MIIIITVTSYAKKLPYKTKKNTIENRLFHDYSIYEAIKENNSYLKRLKKYNIEYILSII